LIRLAAFLISGYAETRHLSKIPLEAKRKRGNHIRGIKTLYKLSP